MSGPLVRAEITFRRAMRLENAIKRMHNKKSNVSANIFEIGPEFIICYLSIIEHKLYSTNAVSNINGRLEFANKFVTAPLNYYALA